MRTWHYQGVYRHAHNAMRFIADVKQSTSNQTAKIMYASEEIGMLLHMHTGLL
jgi:hypothetical protein